MSLAQLRYDIRGPDRSTREQPGALILHSQTPAIGDLRAAAAYETLDRG